jgi:hypothetical protein
MHVTMPGFADNRLNTAVLASACLLLTAVLFGTALWSRPYGFGAIDLDQQADRANGCRQDRCALRDAGKPVAQSQLCDQH